MQLPKGSRPSSRAAALDVHFRRTSDSSSYLDWGGKTASEGTKQNKNSWGEKKVKRTVCVLLGEQTLKS